MIKNTSTNQELIPKPGHDASSPSNETEADDEFEVEAILGVRDLKLGHTPTFFVKWKGYPDSSNTWEPLENLTNCIELVRECVKIILQEKKSTLALTPLQEFEKIFEASPGPKIVVENEVDSEACPPGFKYISESIYGEGVREPDLDFASFCVCGPGGCSVENGCDCMIEAAQVNDEYERVPFEEDGRVSMHTSKLLWECNARCGCGVDCISKASQRGRKFGLKIKRFPGKGWGVVLNQTEPIPPRAFVARYVGEIITNKEALRRGQEYDKKGATWLFDLDYNTENTAEYSIDAYHMGNESHFFNHSCDPNLSVYMLAGNTGGDSSITTHSFWSNRWIYEGDELTFDYNGAANNEGLQQRQQNQQQQKKKKKRQKGQTRCLCGSANCREWVHLFRGK